VPCAWSLVKSTQFQAKALEIRTQEFHFKMDEWNNGRQALASVAIARLVWIGSARDLLAVELDVAGDADGVFVLPVVAGLRAGDGRVGGTADGQFALDPFAARFCSIVRGVFAGVVDFRND
jgi:hypothetical protein